MPPASLRHLHIVLGDQLDPAASGFDGFDPQQDAIWMAEVDEESTHVPSSRQRIALFLSAMRHAAMHWREQGITLHYQAIDAADNTGTLAGELARSIARLKPQGLVMTAPGEWRVLQSLRDTAAAHGLALDVREDRHFMSSVHDFAEHARGRKQLRMEYWYREMRQRHDVLMEGSPAKPVGGQWNFDEDNRESFGKDGPQMRRPPLRHAPDAITREVIDLVNTRFAHHPGTVTASSDGFGWPVHRDQALATLHDFITHRLPHFGSHQDAMWTSEPWLFHAHISSALNMKLLHPREVIAAAEQAYHQGHAPLAAVEGFIRQILGWREYVRGIYWMRMPEYLEMNALHADQPLPDIFWTGKTDAVCLREAIGQTLQHGYAHHIQRLMVTGLYGLLLGVHPKAMHAWYLGVYVDAVEWVELPNTLGMSQFADGGLMASKPYAASGKYIDRMSNYCQGCRYQPAQATGPDACPFTTLYWDFLMRHEAHLAKNPRMVMQVRNLSRLSAERRAEIRAQAQTLMASPASR
jgi:deoxyribodipyrimidine photolyase-related protein